MQITAYGTTDIGRARDRNEDACLIDKQLDLFLVCDGMGGHAAGEVASQKTIEFVVDYLRENKAVLGDAAATPGGYFKVVELAEAATIDASRRLYELASSDADLAGMGTTLTMLIVVDNKAVMSHVGDSRLYLLRDDGLHQLSTDHTFANEMFQRGEFTAEEFEASPFHHVLTRSLGRAEAVESEMLLFDLFPGDTLLLCSDGLTNYVDDPEELAGFLEREDLTSVPEQLVKLANSRGGKDNITAIVVHATADVAADEAQDTRVRADALQSTFLCEGISYSRLIRLVEISEVKTYREGASILREDGPCEGWHMIVSGRAAVSRGGERTSELSVGDCFCETALIRERSARATVDTLETTTVLTLRRNHFQRLTRRLPKMGRVLHVRLLEYLADQLDAAGESV